jgi:hypothetical protein
MKFTGPNLLPDPELRPMYAEKNEKGDITAYRVLCPVCKSYTRLDPKSLFDRELLDGLKSYACYSNECRGSVTLRISYGRAQTSRLPKPDIQKEERSPSTRLYESKPNRMFIQEDKIGRN